MNSAEVATALVGYIAKKLIKQSKCESSRILLKDGEVDIADDAYLNMLSCR